MGDAVVGSGNGYTETIGGIIATTMPSTMDAGDENGFSQSLLTFAAIMTFLIMIVGICGNFLTVVALLKCPKVRNVAAAFIISLCSADLLFCALVLPFQGLRFVQGTWNHGEVLCRLIPFIQYGNIGVSLLCIAMITINRYVMITHHSYYARIYKTHWIAIMIAACWLFSYGMQLPTLLGAWGRFGYDARLQTCSIMSDEHGHSSKTTLFITAFVIPCLVIIACYAKIFWVVHRSEQRMKRHANKQNSIPNNLRTLPAAAVTAPTLPAANKPGAASRVSSDSSSYTTDSPEAQTAVNKQQPSRVKDQREVRAKRNEWRITKMVLAIFLSFVVCYLPITIVKVADKDVEHPSLHIFSYIMLYLSACINPIIYVIMNKQYRKAYKTVVLCQLLPFGKSNGGNGAAEKWKDAGLSKNHSRTVVSQMSAGALAASTQPPASNSSSNPTQLTAPLATATTETAEDLVALEMMTRQTKLSPTPTAVLVTPPSPSQTAAQLQPKNLRPTNGLATQTPNPNQLAAKKNNHSYINNGFNSSSGSGNNSSLYRHAVGMGSANGTTPFRRITMVGDDIILEEEELPTTPRSSATASNEPAATTTTTFKPMNPIYMNVVTPKNAQLYSKPSNDIPVNDALQHETVPDGQDSSKVQTKMKI